MSNNELYHYGILGQKWGRRNYQYEDGSLTPEGRTHYGVGDSRKNRENPRYSSDQKKRDRSVYGRSGASRIEKRVNKGESISGARSREADRINSARRTAQAAGAVGRTIGEVGGAIAGFMMSKKATDALATKFDVVNDPTVNLAVRAAISAGASKVGKLIGSEGGRSIGMLAYGYDPQKYR